MRVELTDKAAVFGKVAKYRHADFCHQIFAPVIHRRATSHLHYDPSDETWQSCGRYIHAFDHTVFVAIQPVKATILARGKFIKADCPIIIGVKFLGLYRQVVFAFGRHFSAGEAGD